MLRPVHTDRHAARPVRRPPLASPAVAASRGAAETAQGVGEAAETSTPLSAEEKTRLFQRFDDFLARPAQAP